MASPKFPAPAYDSIQDTGPQSGQIKRVDLDYAEIAGRKSTDPGKMEKGAGGMVIKHVG